MVRRGLPPISMESLLLLLDMDWMEDADSILGSVNPETISLIK